MDLATSTRVFDHYLYARSDRGAVRRFADQLQTDPVIRMTRVGEDGIEITVARIRPADVRDHFLLPVVVQIAERDPMPFLQVAKTTRGGHALEAAAAVVSKHFVGHETGEGRRARTEIKIQKSIVIQIAQVRRHRQENVI